MRCPFCGVPDTQVRDSRPVDDGNVIRRRRFCPRCAGRFSTREQVNIRELTVIKMDGRREPFDRDKLALSLKKALRKRAVQADRVELIVNGMVRQLEIDTIDGDVSSQAIGVLAMETLREVDGVAYVRFASINRDFRDVSDFEVFIRGMGDNGAD